MVTVSVRGGGGGRQQQQTVDASLSVQRAELRALATGAAPGGTPSKEVRVFVQKIKDKYFDPSVQSDTDHKMVFEYGYSSVGSEVLSKLGRTIIGSVESRPTEPQLQVMFFQLPTKKEGEVQQEEAEFGNNTIRMLVVRDPRVGNASAKLFRVWAPNSVYEEKQTRFGRNLTFYYIPFYLSVEKSFAITADEVDVGSGYQLLPIPRTALRDLETETVWEDVASTWLHPLFGIEGEFDEKKSKRDFFHPWLKRSVVNAFKKNNDKAYNDDASEVGRKDDTAAHNARQGWAP